MAHSLYHYSAISWENRKINGSKNSAFIVCVYVTDRVSLSTSNYTEVIILGTSQAGAMFFSSLI